jgi:hypothetical protein
MLLASGGNRGSSSENRSTKRFRRTFYRNFLLIAALSPACSSLSAMHASERNRLLREVRRFQFAQADMLQAAAAAEALLREDTNRDLCRALETAIAVIYARPFTSSNKIGALGPEWAPPEPTDRSLHDQLREKRDQVYAHSDVTPLRDVIDIGAALGKDHPVYSETWYPVSRPMLPIFIRMAREQEKRFYDAAVERETKLGAKQLGNGEEAS